MQAPLDYKQIPGVPVKRTVAAVTSFVVRTTEFLNKFSALCETKLARLARDLDRLEITMNILDAKLASIAGLEDVRAPESSSVESAPPSSDSHHASSSAMPASSSMDFGEASGEEAAPHSSAIEVEVDPSKPRIRDDPRYEKYFKFVRLGAPMQQIRMQMAAEGLDPSLLDDPDAEAPAGPPASKSRVAVAESSSDDDEEEEVVAAPPPPPPPMDSGEQKGFQLPAVDDKDSSTAVDKEDEGEEAVPPPPPGPPPPPALKEDGNSSDEFSEDD